MQTVMVFVCVTALIQFGLQWDRVQPEKPPCQAGPCAAGAAGQWASMTSGTVYKPLQCQRAPIHTAEKAAVINAGKAKSGTLLIVGANIGNDKHDPIWPIVSGEEVKHLDKVYVEPVPPTFKKLQNNLQSIPRAQAVHAVIANQSGVLPFYCIGLNMTTGTTTREAKRLGGRSWWSECCSLSRERFWSDYDMGKTLKQRQAIQHLVMEIKVPAYTPEAFMKAYVKSPVLYLSIDAESLDDVILANFPFESNPSFRPAAVVFEYTTLGRQRIDAALMRLQRVGYTSCKKEEQNIIVFHR